MYNERRRTIWTAFSSYLPSLLKIPEVDVFYVDGSFTTNRDKPGDIDVIVELENPLEYARIFSVHGPMIERKFVKSTFFTDLLFAYRQAPLGIQDIRELFQEIKLADALSLGLNPSTRKGLLRLKLR